MTTVKRINGDYNIKTLGASDDINIDTHFVNIDGNLSVTGNVLAAFYYGDGRFLTNVNVANVSVTSNAIANGTSNVSIPIASGNVVFGVSGTGNVVIVSAQGVNIPTNVPSTSNITGALRITGGVGVVGNIYADAMYANNAEVLTVNSVINGGTY